ncbi:hypothetical protein GM658_18685 [Pseudoduganella eburnea]|uniref:HTH luxR-type domain-containing protein n=1 Tax=Massilia eburnea TaxID=1776165 RepID=A0A6L6QKI9_9BURK|nr:LuxR C-terminal-related transcriptional regulator [Massilia eburnea]MTW12640.1 hypothetical protein [Massilia eburnea]
MSDLSHHPCLALLADQILATKFVIPAATAQLLARPRLQHPELAPRVVLLCAPAGYGKTTLAASWAAASSTPVAWLSLDAGDNDPLRFLVHFIHAIQGQCAEFGKVMADMCALIPPPPISALMRPLVNLLCALPERLCIILDDLQLVTEPAVHEAIAFLVDHQPARLQLIFASRSEPPFSLARLRGQGQIVEYRGEDLRFSLPEVEAFCNEVMQLSLPPEQVSTLAERTEGWIVGLHLAAVALSHHHDKAAFVRTFTGDNRHVSDFLLDEVLHGLADETLNFLLQTSMLERFNAALCDAVTGRDDSHAVISEIERANLFIFRLDEQRLWYRYHHLFGALLESRLRAAAPSSVGLLHRRASKWFSENGFITEAVVHALAAPDHESAADLMETHHSELFSHGRMGSALAWSRQLPESVLAERPLLSMVCAWGYLYLDEMAELERHLCLVDKCLAGFHDAPFGGKERAMLGQLALLRGCQSAYQGHIDKGIAHFDEAQASLAPGRTLFRAAAVARGVFYFVSGRMEESQRLLEDNVLIRDATHNVQVPITAACALARSHLLRGRPLAAKQIYDKTIQALLVCGWQYLPACGMLHIGLGEVAYEMNELALAEQHLVRGVEMTAAGLQYVNAWGRVLLAKTRKELGKAAEAWDPQFEVLLLRYAGRLVVEIAPLSAVIAGYWLSLGKMDAVQLWSEAARLPLEPALAPGREAEYLVQARFFILAGRRSQALDLLERLWYPAVQGKRLAVMTEIQVLKAICLQKDGRSDEAMMVLQQGVSLAENTHLLRVFINEGEALSGMLKKLARGADYKSYVHTLLGHMGADAAQESAQTFERLPQLFSKKEKLVVSHIARGATNHEIAESLFISLNTLNSHVKKIYVKLGVNSRLQAAERLRQLGLAE